MCVLGRERALRRGLRRGFEGLRWMCVVCRLTLHDISRRVFPPFINGYRRLSDCAHILPFIYTTSFRLSLRDFYRLFSPYLGIFPPFHYRWNGRPTGHLGFRPSAVLSGITQRGIILHSSRSCGVLPFKNYSCTDACFVLMSFVTFDSHPPPFFQDNTHFVWR